MNTRDLEAALSRVERRYRQIAREISPLDLHRSEDSEASLGDLTDLQLGLGHRDESRSALFVGYYTEEGLRDALSRYGFLGAMAQRLGLRGAEQLALRIDTRDPFHHLLRISVADEVPIAAPERLLMELRVHLREHPMERAASDLDLAPPAPGYVVCEWLTLQHPGAAFRAERPRLPGQVYPGLGLGAEVQTLLMLMTERLSRQGLLAYPAYCHTAAMYSLRFHAVDPRAEGRIHALLRDADGLSLAELSWAVELGCVRLLRAANPTESEEDDPPGALAATEASATGEPWSWRAAELLLPVGAGARAYLNQPAYLAERARAFEAHRFHIDRRALAARLPEAEARADVLARRVYAASMAAQGGWGA